MIKTEFKVDGEVKKTRHSAAASIAFPPFERSEAAAEKIHELMHAEPFPDMDEIFNAPELLKQVEDAAREAEIGGQAPRKMWAARVVCKDGKGRVVSAIPPDEEEVFLDDDGEIPPAQPVDEQPAQVQNVANDLLCDYLLARARMVTNGATYVEELNEQELADVCAMSRRRFIPFTEWVKRRFPE